MAPGCLTGSTVNLNFPGRLHSESGVYMECSAFFVQPLRVLRLENIGTFQKGAGFSYHKLSASQFVGLEQWPLAWQLSCPCQHFSVKLATKLMSIQTMHFSLSQHKHFMPAFPSTPFCQSPPKFMYNAGV